MVVVERATCLTIENLRGSSGDIFIARYTPGSVGAACDETESFEDELDGHNKNIFSGTPRFAFVWLNLCVVRIWEVVAATVTRWEYRYERA